MSSFHEFETLQNDALGAVLVWAACTGFITARPKEGMPLVYGLLVLPIAYNRRLVEALHSRWFDGGLFSAQGDDKTIFLGLQERMGAMVSQSYGAINLALNADLIKYSRDETTIKSIRKSRPNFKFTEDIKDMIGTSERLGYWLGTIPYAALTNSMGIRI
jgi:hypothetical protein